MTVDLQCNADVHAGRTTLIGFPYCNRINEKGAQFEQKIEFTANGLLQSSLGTR